MNYQSAVTLLSTEYLVLNLFRTQTPTTDQSDISPINICSLSLHRLWKIDMKEMHVYIFIPRLVVKMPYARKLEVPVFRRIACLQQPWELYIEHF